MSPLRWIILAVVVVVVLAVGGPFFYIHVIEGSAPSKFSLSSLPGGGGPSVPLDGTWSISSGSQVGYRVTEVLFGQNNTAVGRSSAVKGSISISGAKVTSGSFTVDMSTVKSDQGSRNRQFQGPLLEVSRFPTATFKLTKSIDFGTPPADGVVKDVTGTGDLTLHGVTKTVSIPLQVRHQGATISVVGSTNIVFADYSIADPSTLFNGITTQNHGTLEFELSFAKGSSSSATSAAPTTTLDQAAAQAAFAQCMTQHGAQVPTGFGGGGAPGGGGSGGGGGGPGGGGFGGGPGGPAPGGASGGATTTEGPTTTIDPVTQQALAACRGLLPQSGPPRADVTTVPPFGFGQ